MSQESSKEEGNGASIPPGHSYEELARAENLDPDAFRETQRADLEAMLEAAMRRMTDEQIEDLMHERQHLKAALSRVERKLEKLGRPVKTK